MPNLMKELKAEIARLAKKEANAIVVPVKKINASQRGLIAGLRRQVDAMQKELSGLKKAVPAPDKAALAKQEPEGRFWITGKGAKALRVKLGLTQAKFAKLVSVSLPTVGNWEGTEGKINLRKATAGKLQAIRGMGKKQAAEILGLGKEKAETPKAKEKVSPKAKKLKAKAKPKKASVAKAKASRKAKTATKTAAKAPKA